MLRRIKIGFLTENSGNPDSFWKSQFIVCMYIYIYIIYCIRMYVYMYTHNYIYIYISAIPRYSLLSDHDRRLFINILYWTTLGFLMELPPKAPNFPRLIPVGAGPSAARLSATGPPS